MSGTKKTLVALAPDGSRVTLVTSGGYDTAGLVHDSHGWHVVERGWSQDSVTKRTKSCYYRTSSDNWVVVSLHEQVPAAMETYFGPSFIGTRIAQVFTQAEGWKPASVRAYPGRTTVRRLARDGYTAISVTCYGHGPVDFQMSELVKR